MKNVNEKEIMINNEKNHMNEFDDVMSMIEK